MLRSSIVLLAALAPLAALASCADTEPTASCKAFVACVRALDARDGQTTDARRFEAGGACWDGPAGADACDHACAAGLVELRATAPDLACEVAP